MCINLNHRVYDLNKEGNSWRLDILDKQSGERKQVKAKFVFLGAGGGSFPLLQKSGLSEGRGYGGFPVGGLWLVCKDRKNLWQGFYWRSTYVGATFRYAYYQW